MLEPLLAQAFLTVANGPACSFCWVTISGPKVDSNPLTIAYPSILENISAITARVGKSLLFSRIITVVGNYVVCSNFKSIDAETSGFFFLGYTGSLNKSQYTWSLSQIS